MKKFDKVKKEIVDNEEINFIDKQVKLETFYKDKEDPYILEGKGDILDKKLTNLLYGSGVIHKRNKDFDRNEDELVFGIKRICKKIISYTDSIEEEDFYKDDLVFDGCLYCLIEIQNIAKKIVNNEKIKKFYYKIDFKSLATIYKQGIKKDHLNISYFSNACYYLIPYTLMLMYQLEGVI